MDMGVLVLIGVGLVCYLSANISRGHIERSAMTGQTVP